MFEKEAEELANKKLCSERICYNHCNFNSPKHHRCGEWHRIYDCAKESVEFGYNKAKGEPKEENAELKEQCSILADCNTCHSTCKNENLEMKKQLTKAKEIIQKLCDIVCGRSGDEQGS